MHAPPPFRARLCGRPSVNRARPTEKSDLRRTIIYRINDARRRKTFISRTRSVVIRSELARATIFCRSRRINDVAYNNGTCREKRDREIVAIAYKLVFENIDFSSRRHRNVVFIRPTATKKTADFCLKAPVFFWYIFLLRDYVRAKSLGRVTGERQ